MFQTQPSVKRLQAIGMSGLLFVATGGAHAAGIFLIEQSVSSMGTAYAGAGSAGQDASQLYFNPAIMSRLNGEQLSAGLHVVIPKDEFTGIGTFNATNPLVAGAGLGGSLIPPVPQGDGGDAGETGAVPHFSYVRDIDERWKFGLTVNAPYGLATKYDQGWTGRYNSVEGEILSVNLNPNISFEIDDHTTIGVGVSALYAKLEYRNNIDYALLDIFGLLDPTGGGASILPGAPPPGTSDAFSEVDVDDWGFGYNFGVLLEPTEHTRFGFAFRSKVELEMEGDLTVSHSILPTVSDGAKVEISLPSTLTLSAYHDVNPSWAVMADLMWMSWSNINSLTIQRSSGAPPTVIPLDWEDAIRLSVGASYKQSDALTLRAGVAFDESPVTSPELRITALPDDDRIWLTLGAGYKPSKKLSFDFGYAHLFIDDPDINSTDSETPPLASGFHRVTGSYDASVDIISAQVNWAFD